jgi:hypothetical protein
MTGAAGTAQLVRRENRIRTARRTMLIVELVFIERFLIVLNVSDPEGPVPFFTLVSCPGDLLYT